MKYYMNIFIIFSIVGYIFEAIMKHFFFHSIDIQTLYGPWIPIYGLGTCIIILIMKWVYKHFNDKIIRIVLIFTISAIILSILELIGGYLMERLTNKAMWDYSDLKFNIGKYIALEVSLIWGFMSLVIVYLVKPWLDKIINKIPKLITYSVFFIFTVDILISIINKI